MVMNPGSIREPPPTPTIRHLEHCINDKLCTVCGEPVAPNKRMCYVHIATANSDVTTREICEMCHQVNAVGFLVPDGVWRLIIPIDFQNKVVCLQCFAKLGDEKRIRWDLNIKFFPVSFVTHRNPDLESFNDKS